MQPFFMNSVRMVIPAVLISSIIGAFNGYVLTHWRFRGADPIFTHAAGRLLHSVPGDPAADGALEGLSRPVEHRQPGLVVVHVIYGIAFTHDVLPQLLREHSG